MVDLNLNDVAVFARVVELGGFAGAARELGCPTSTVSRAVLRLEATTGLRLLHRTTRNMRPSSEGRQLYADVATAVSTLQRAARAIEPTNRKPKGRLRVTAPNDLCSSFLADVIVAFAERHPLVQLDFSLMNRSANIVDEGFDVALRATAQLADSSLIARKLGVIEQRLYASPEYLARHGTPTKVADLPEHRCVVFRGEELVKTWALRDATGAVPVRVQGRVGGDDFTFVRSIVLAGGGIGLLPHINTAREEAAGRLVRVLPEVSMPGATLYVLYPSARNLPARVSAFRDFVVEAYEAWAIADTQR